MNEFLNTMQGYGQYSWNAPAWLGPVLILAIIWTMVWKGLALWKAARSGSKVWFVILLLVNTIGILDLIYYFTAKKNGVSSTQTM